MQKFYICTTGIAKGPFLLEDLYKESVSEHDLIWGSKWRKARYAKEIGELRKHFCEKWAENRETDNRSRVGIKKSVLSGFLSLLLLLILYFLWIS